MASRKYGNQVTAVIQTRVRESYTPGIVAKAADAMGKQYVREIQDQTMKGFDANGNKLRKNKKSTIKQKRLRLKRRPPRGRFAAEKATNVARMTGQTLRDMIVKGSAGQVERSAVTATFVVDYKTKRSRNVSGYLRAGGRPIDRLAPKSTAMGRAARRRILAIGHRIIQTTARVKGVVVDGD